MLSRLFFLGASISEAGFPFVRNLILARVLSPTDFGVAVLIATIWSLSEVCLDLGLDRYVMRHATIDAEPRGLPTLQSLLLGRSFVVAALIVLSAYYFSTVMHAPELFLPLLVVAVSTVVRGASNLRAQVCARDGNFFPHASVILMGQIAWTAITVAVVLVMPSPVAMAWGIAAGHVVGTVASHAFVGWNWRLGWSTPIARDALFFGAPLVPNGMASAAIYMGDRILVASFFGLKAVGLYTVLITVAFLLSGVLLRSLGSIFLPLFANTERSETARTELNRSWLTLVTGFAFVYSVGVITVAVPLIPFVFGRDYQADSHYAVLLGLAAFSRAIHTVGVPPMMARGNTVYALYVHFGLACSVGVGVAGALLGQDLFWFMIGLFFGELLVAISVVVGLPAILNQPFSFTARTVVAPYIALCLISVAALKWQGPTFYMLMAGISVLILVDLGLRVAPLLGKHFPALCARRTPVAIVDESKQLFP
jgi:O-antigen/teichoic acid export membrane protein